MPLYPNDFLCDFCKKNLGNEKANQCKCEDAEKIFPSAKHFALNREERRKAKIKMANNKGIIHKMPIGIGCTYFDGDQEKYDADPRTKEE